MEEEKKQIEQDSKEVPDTPKVVEETPKTKEDMILAKLDKIQKEIWYSRLAMAVFLVISLFYINMKTNNIANALATFIEMFMPE